MTFPEGLFEANPVGLGAEGRLVEYPTGPFPGVLTLPLGLPDMPVGPLVGLLCTLPPLPLYPTGLLVGLFMECPVGVEGRLVGPPRV